MEKILKALGLKPVATEDDALNVITNRLAENEELKAINAKAVQRIAELEKAPGKKELTAREKMIDDKMKAGLSREIAAEATDNQLAEDAAKAKKK